MKPEPNSSSREPAIRIQNLTVTYKESQKLVKVLDNINLTVEPGQICALIGPSGCGKSTLLRAVAGLTHDYEGTVAINGEPVDPHRLSIGFMPQNYGLLPWKNVQDNVGLACRIKKQPVAQEKRDRLLSDLGLAGFERRYPREPSGGQQQRVGLAREFLLEPDILLMDEPFSALDAITREEMQNIFLRLWQENSVTTLLVTHYVEEALYLAQTIVVFSASPGQVRRVMANPLAGDRAARGGQQFQQLANQLHDMLRGEVEH